MLGVLTVLTYNTWLCWRPFNGHPEIFDGYLSELSASDQPYHLFFRGGDLITALIVLALGVRTRSGSWRHRGRRLVDRGRGRPCCCSASRPFFDAFFAMDCSPTLSEACRVAEEAGRLSTVHYAHTFTSVGAQAGIVASMVAACDRAAPIPTPQP